MADFNTSVFVKDLGSQVGNIVKPILKDSIDSIDVFNTAMVEIEKNIQKTIEAIKNEVNIDKINGLKMDLELAFPSQKASLESALAFHIESDVQDALDKAWEILVKTAATAARAFVGA